MTEYQSPNLVWGSNTIYKHKKPNKQNPKQTSPLYRIPYWRSMGLCMGILLVTREEKVSFSIYRSQTQRNRAPNFVLIIKKDLRYHFASIFMRKKWNTFPFSTINLPWLKRFNIYTCIDHFQRVAKQHSSLPSITYGKRQREAENEKCWGKQIHPV